MPVNRTTSERDDPSRGTVEIGHHARGMAVVTMRQHRVTSTVRSGSSLSGARVALPTLVLSPLPHTNACAQRA